MQQKLTQTQSLFLLILRFTIGWHFLYEGVSKMLIPGWTSAEYLENSRWILSGFFHSIAANPAALLVVDWINIIGLTVVGLGLVLGVFTRTAGLVGILFLASYYVANPPFVGIDFGLPAEGHYLFVNKNLVEMAALLVLVVFPTRSVPGIDRFVLWLRQKKKAITEAVDSAVMDQGRAQSAGRREAVKNFLSLPLLGLFAYGSVKKYRWESVNAITGATIKVSDTTLGDLTGELPKGKIGDYQISRLIMGGNLIGGWAHSRDLIYVPSLFKAYNTEMKFFDTMELAEKAGINTINITGSQYPLINKYKRVTGSELQTICQVHPTKEDPFLDIDNAINNGVDLIQIQGNCCDFRVRDGEMDVLVTAVDYIHQQGYLAGMGAHSIQALMACDEAGIEPDFFMKTLHHDQYWSAHPRENRIPFQVDGDLSLDHDEFHDNMFCLFPDETIDFMSSKEIPWIAFKVLAGGAIHPQEGFPFAFGNGADFICVGMFDWQVVDDVNIAIDMLPRITGRPRPWMG